MRLFFLIINLTAIFYSATAQLHEQFSDGNFSREPRWSGDTSRFIINADSSLQLNDNTSGTAYLSTPSTVINQASWQLSLRMDFNPSSNNFTDVYLVSDMPNLTAPLNGYFVRLGGTQDEVSLYRQAGSAADIAKIIDGADKLLDSPDNNISLKVLKNHENEWQLWVKLNDGNFTQQGAVMDSAMVFSKFFGVVCHYTSTRADKFYFDDIQIDGLSYTDTNPPAIDSLTALSDSSLYIHFNEKVLLDEMDKSNFLVEKSIGNPWKLVPGDSALILYFQTKFASEEHYTLTATVLTDLFGNSTDLSVSFVYVAPHLAIYHEVLLTEIMADPTPGVNLPEYEYLELYNPTQYKINLENYLLAVGADTTHLPAITIIPDEYLVLCSSAALPHFAAFTNAGSVPNWPSLNNRGDEIAMYNTNGDLLFYVAYDDSWYKSIEKDDGGWSLEMIDASLPCLQAENWSASANPDGGTPGAANASATALTDLTGPTISRIIANTDSSATIFLSENIGPQSMEKRQFSMTPEVAISDIRLMAPAFNTVNVSLQNTLQPRTAYEVTLTDLEDCWQNRTASTSGFVYQPEMPDSLDVIINEILFDPKPGGVDFVEIYNPSDKYIDLQHLVIANQQAAPIATRQHVMEPGQFFALTPDAQLLKNYYPHTPEDRIVEVANMPAFNNDEGDVLLMTDQNQALDFFHYDVNYHSPYLQDKKGVSLERISISGPSNDPNNWQSAASSRGFATPGEANSQAVSRNANAETVSVDPVVFDPGNNGFRDFTTIRCRFDQPGNVISIYIVDVAGRKVRTIATQLPAGTEEDFKWDGMNELGQEVRLGYYIVYVETINGNGTRQVFRKKVVVGHPM